MQASGSPGGSRVAPRPEVLAPAGDPVSLRAALAAGADAVYFGLDDGFNARARASNFAIGDLPAITAEVHRAGARAYLTLNTLVFESELETVEALVRQIALAGVDALIVQDPAVCLVAKAVCPELELHASTQMTISSAEGVRFAQALGCTRVVLPRELSVAEIALLRGQTDVELEVFVHGALCVSWSGQCLSSEAWGGRSANRGQCAQACRMPYELVVDGERRPSDELRYPLSPRDLAGHRALPALWEAGVHTLKIEGRLKGPAYVATAVEGVRGWLDAIADGSAHRIEGQQALARSLARAAVTYSRGFGDGFLGGADHQNLVPGAFPRSRGALLGVVRAVDRGEVLVVPSPAGRPRGAGPLAAPLPAFGAEPDAATGPPVAPIEPRPGLGVVFDAGRPEDRDEPGGPIFAVRSLGDGWALRFGRPGPDLRRVAPGQRVWITGDPDEVRRAHRLADQRPEGRIPIDLVVSGEEGGPLRVSARAAGHVVEHRSEGSLVAARPAGAAGLDASLLAEKLAAFGGTPFRLRTLDPAGLQAGLHLPVSRLKALRRAIVADLEGRIERGPSRELRPVGLLPGLGGPVDPAPGLPSLVPLVRTPEQLDAVIAAGLAEVELDWMEMVGLERAVVRARRAGLRVVVATVRVQKPGEEGYDRRIERLEPDAVLVRHWGALVHFAERPDGDRPLLHGDFSLNVTNSVTAGHLLRAGLRTVTAAHDLDARQLRALLDRVPPGRVGVTVHHHIPTFHNEHCVYAAHLSQGRDYRSCGRPCDRHRLALRDHRGLDHPVIVDVGCRNTVFNAEAQSAASLVPELVERGVARLRLEFVWETGPEASAVLEAYAGLVAGRIGPDEALRRVGVHEQFGVTAGTMRVIGASG